MQKIGSVALVAMAVSVLALAACGGGYGGGGYNGGGGGTSSSSSSSVSMTAYSASQVAGDQAAAGVNVDANLINGWGLAIHPPGFIWVADNGTSKASLYDGNGIAQSAVISISPGLAGTAHPTGIVYNDSTTSFKLSGGGITAPAPMIFASEAGTISAWSPAINPPLALTVFDGNTLHAVYKGLAILTGSVNRLYAADFHNNRIDVFDGAFNRIAVSGSFTDASVPAGYAPFNVQAFGGQLYVTYAKTTAGSDIETTGAGLGYVAVFDSNGNLVKHLASGGALNAPWGLAMAPANFGSFSNALLVGNFGDGKINAYDPTTGALLGTLSKGDGTAIVVPGLWGLAFGDGAATRPANTLFYAAGPGNAAHGAFGRIEMH
ncbi:MAG TPA: TIGR03118 family protein [Asticcacaulis sp.]|nr:TIGR03118 family protein [Asticcacaulis sp.]